MNKLQSIVGYLCNNYPHKAELSNARLTKLVYLADWFSSLADSKQLTNIDWIFNHYGPYVPDVFNSVTFNNNFVISNQQTTYGSDKYVINYRGSHDFPNLTNREKQILDLVIRKTEHMYFNDFIDYVYSTYPVQSKDRYSHLNLPSLAQEYKNVAPFN